MPSRTVIFAEKPSQGKAYSEAYNVESRTKTHIILSKCPTFPTGALITWGIGHLVGLKMPQEYKDEWSHWSLKTLPIIPEKFEYKPTDSVISQFRAVKKIFKECEQNKGLIINSVDLDREGSNIFHSTLYLTGVKNVEIKRLWINSLEKDEVRKGFSNLRNNEQDLLMYKEARARQIADWLVGMNLSPLYSLTLQKQGFQGSLSIGRVQTPAVRLIYDRQKEIESFVSKPFYEIHGVFNHENGIYTGKADVKCFSKEEVEGIYSEYDLSNKDEGYIQTVTKKEKAQLSPKLHSLSTLQTKANKLWKYSPAEVLKTVQTLYEKKIVSYPRTDSNYITESEFNYLCENVERYKSLLNVDFEADLNPKTRYVDNGKVVEHYAIIPTKTIPDDSTLNSLSDKEKNIYNEILKITLAMFHQDYLYEETIIITNVKNLEFKTTGKVEKQKGWKELITDTKKETKEDVLPSVQKGDELTCLVETKEKKTTAPKPYTQGDLINLMKTAGRFVDDDDDSNILKEVEGIGTEATRSGIIERIMQQEYINVNKNIVNVTKKGEILCESVEGTLLASPSMTAKWESYLKKIGEGNGSEEHFIANVIKFINETIKEVPDKLKVNTSINENIKETQKVDGVADCPSCDGQIVDRKKFYGCSGWKEGCKITFPKKIAQKTLSKSMINTLCTKRKTNKLKGFTGKKGKFDAKLKLSETNKVEFSFD